MSLLTFGDLESGRSLDDWGNEFVYAMGQSFDFEKTDFTKPHVVLAIVCLRPSLAVRNTVSLRAKGAEFWSTFNASHSEFTSCLVSSKITAIKDALIGAVQQIPDKRMPADIKADFFLAAEVASKELTASPGRHPR